MDGTPHVTQHPVQPGGTFVYEFTPKDAGTFWFHPHVRGSEQVERGLYGVLVVEDRQPPPFSREVAWVLDDWLLTPAHEIATELRLPPVGFMPAALDALKAGAWPGNVRELRNVIERAVVLSDGERIDRQHLPEQLAEGAPSDRPEIRQRVADIERDMLRAALDAAAGNQTRAAKQLGISRFALIRLLAKHGIKPEK